ncbi:MAG: AAA family ATPase [Bacteroidetes bacterium]|nr:AAA family ATPase [Bacteroidota bacterium]
MQLFNAQMLKLNSEQLTAVNQIEGPVMVIAGPGTGKTQILAERIAKILSITDCSPHNILCLTFTEAGTTAMRSRLLKTIGMQAHNISIHTFHSFCNRVIQENPEAFQYRNLQPVTELEKIQMLNQLATDLPQDHVLKKIKGNVGYLVGQLKTLFTWMKREGVTSTEIGEDSANYLEEVYNSDKYRYKRKTGKFEAGDLKEAEVKKIESRISELKAGSELLEDFTALMESEARYDFDDMILWVLDLFKNDKAVLDNYREKFQYILVDEFQDTSGSQNKLITYLTDYWDAPNVFVVGDDDQSIYRFQGAEIKNITDFAFRYKDSALTVVLKKNYRSTQEILDASEQLITNNESRLVNQLEGLNKHLESQRFTTGPVISVSFDTQIHESVWIISRIKKLVEQGVSPTEIAVIYRKHQHGEQSAKLLSLSEIPVYFHRSENAIFSELNQQIISLLRYINDEISLPLSADHHLFKILHFPFFNCKNIDISRFSFQCGIKRIKWREGLSKISDSDDVFSEIDQYGRINLSEAGLKIEEWISSFQSKPVLVAIQELVSEFYTNTNTSNSNDSFELECLKTLLDMVESEIKLNPSLTLNDLVLKIDLMNDYKISLPCEHVLFDTSGVQFMTAHASKGLEFDYVFIINASANAWEKERKNSPLGFINIYDPEDENLSFEEKRRLFYVAMTRARKGLYISNFQHTDSGKDNPRSSFVDDLVLSQKIEEQHPEINMKEAESALRKLLISPDLNKAELLDNHLIDEFIAGYQLSASHLNAYLECPISFYFNHILRVPSPRNKYLSFGTAIHKSLDQLFKSRKNQSGFNSAILRSSYEQALMRERFVFTEREYQDFLSLGQNVLTEYFNERENFWISRTHTETEVALDRITIGNVPVKGQLDLMDVEQENVQVFDFKTGDAQKSRGKLIPPQFDNLDAEGDKKYGGPYWRQMMFYALMVKNNPVNRLRMTSGIFEFVEPDENKEFHRHRIVIDDDGLQFMMNLIEDVYQKIQDRQFLNGCGNESCTWCNFVNARKNNSSDE